MSLLDSRNASELSRELVKSFFLCFLSEFVVHIGPFVILALSRVKKIFLSVTVFVIDFTTDARLCQ